MSDDLEIDPRWLKARGDSIDAVHLHWPETLWRRGGFGGYSRVRRAASACGCLLQLFRFVRAAQRRGVRCIWTVQPEFADMKLDPEGFNTAARRGERTVPALFDLLLRSFGERHGARIIGEKTPNHLLYMPILESFFPGARFVHIIRDPRAVVSSWRTVPWSTGTIAGDAGVWRRYMRTAWKQPPSRGKLHVMRYEALTSHPEQELRRVCDFLRIPFDAAMLSFHQRESETIDFAREPWKRSAALPIQARAHDEWRRTLSQNQVEEIEQVCWTEMMRLDYEPENHPGPPLLGPARRVMKRLVSRVR